MDILLCRSSGNVFQKRSDTEITHFHNKNHFGVMKSCQIRDMVLF